MNIYVIIVTYNASPWLSKCLNSLISANHQLHTVVVDNNSTDDTLAILQKDYRAITLIKNLINLGFGKANNLGIKYALSNNADYIVLLNQDAWLRLGTIDELVRISTRHPEYYILSPLHLNGSEAQLDLNFSKYAGPDYCEGFLSDVVVNKTNLQEVYETNFVNAAIWLMPIECVKKIGGFDPLFPHYGEDDDFINRIHYHGYKAGICPFTIGIHDRSQEPFDLKKLDTKSRYNRMKVGLLISLKNINKSFLREIVLAYATVIMGTLKSAVKLNGTQLLLHLQLLIYVSASLQKILVNRKLSKQPGMTVKWFDNLN